MSAVAPHGIKTGERVQLGVREERARKLSGRSILFEDAIPASADDVAGLIDDNGADWDRAGPKGLPRELERSPPRRIETGEGHRRGAYCPTQGPERSFAHLSTLEEASPADELERPCKLPASETSREVNSVTAPLTIGKRCRRRRSICACSRGG
ncbi:MAG: hypothetical protein WEB06_03495 [Actinomycetota bacterium]